MTTQTFRKSRLAGVAMIVLAPLALSACGSVRPMPMTAAEQADRAHSDRETLMAGHKALTGPLTLEEAIANPVEGQDTTIQDTRLLRERTAEEIAKATAYSMQTQTAKLTARS